MTVRSGAVELGLGLLSIGRHWGVDERAPPGPEDALALLRVALDLGIRTFDTAPAYGRSEAVLGTFLSQLDPAVRNEMVVMTKAGESWNEADGTSTIDHGEASLCRSIDRSMTVLGRIDVLQVHRAASGVPASPGVVAAVRYARTIGIGRIGASVTDLAAGFEAVRSGLYDTVQFPLNRLNPTFLPLLAEMAGSHVRPIVNRPFAMGALVAPGREGDAARQAFRFAAAHIDQGTILTGTGSATHLRDNVGAFLGHDAVPRLHTPLPGEAAAPGEF